MDITYFMIRNKKVAEFKTNKKIIKNVQDALDVMVMAQTDYIVLHEYNFGKDFFDLSSRVAGEILQKFTNYHIKMAIIGDFKRYKSKSLRDFMYESNMNMEYLFVSSINEVHEIWGKTV